jgi:ribosomal protein S18 acetylase RimI-like enzyme
MGQDIVLRAAVSADIAPLVKLARSTFRAAFAAVNTPEDMDSYLRQAFADQVISTEFADHNNTFVVAVADGQLVGYMKLRRGSSEPSIDTVKTIELERLYTATEQIGRGIGAQFMQEAIHIARTEHCESLWLGVWENNTGALRFYQRQGFVDVGSHAFMLGEDRQVDRIMELKL